MKTNSNDERQHARDLELVKTWCSKKGISVEINSVDVGQYIIESKTIEINKRLSTLTQTCILLHECGHFLIIRSQMKGTGTFGKAGLELRYPSKQRTKSNQFKVDLIDEEFEAWHRGWALAERLNLSVTSDEFSRVRTRMIKRYFDWAVYSTGKAGEP